MTAFFYLFYKGAYGEVVKKKLCFYSKKELIIFGRNVVCSYLCTRFDREQGVKIDILLKVSGIGSLYWF